MSAIAVRSAASVAVGSIGRLSAHSQQAAIIPCSYAKPLVVRRVEQRGVQRVANGRRHVARPVMAVAEAEVEEEEEAKPAAPVRQGKATKRSVLSGKDRVSLVLNTNSVEYIQWLLLLTFLFEW
jgi:hypothetical protein